VSGGRRRGYRNDCHDRPARTCGVVCGPFDYAALETPVRSLVRKAEKDIETKLKRSAEDIRQIGERLVEVKEALGHGEFCKWLEHKFEWSDFTAKAFMRVSECFKSEKFSDLDVAPSALYAMASPSCPDEVRQELLWRAKSGETITHAKAKEAVAEFKQKDDEDKPPLTLWDAVGKLHASIERFIENQPPEYREPLARQLVVISQNLLVPDAEGGEADDVV
jgi:hypothetical protein